MKNRKRKVLATQEFMHEAREAIKANEELARFALELITHVEEILSDGQLQQMQRWIDELESKI